MYGDNSKRVGGAVEEDDLATIPCHLRWGPAMEQHQCGLMRVERRIVSESIIGRDSSRPLLVNV